MSIESQALVWAHSKAEGAALLAMLCIADHDGDGGSWPSMDTIAQRARVTRDAARKIVRRLENAGEIITDRNGGGGLRTANHMRTNRYEITLECPPECDRSARHRCRPEAVDNTPQPAGGDPAGGLGAPQPGGGANHPLTTPIGNSSSRSEKSREQNRDSESEELEQGSPATKRGQKIAKAAREATEAAGSVKPVKRPDLSAPGRRPYGVQPAPKIPRYVPPPPPEPPPVFTPEQSDQAELLRLERCPSRPSGKPHTIPEGVPLCLNCNTDLERLANGNHNET